MNSPGALAAFTAARVDEDEAAARAAAGAPGRYGGRPNWKTLGTIVVDAEDPDNWGVLDLSPYIDAEEMTAHVARHDPARVLREVAAKRARLALMVEATAEMDRLLADDHAARAGQAMAVGRARAATVAVKHDASVWSDHPDYRQEWAP